MRWFAVAAVAGMVLTWLARWMFPGIAAWIVKAFVFRLITVNEPIAHLGREIGVPFLAIAVNNLFVAAACYAFLPIAQLYDPARLKRFPAAIRQWALKEEPGQIPWIERMVAWAVTWETGGQFSRVTDPSARRAYLLAFFLPAFTVGLQGFYLGVVFGLSNSGSQWMETFVSIAPHGLPEFLSIMTCACVPLWAAEGSGIFSRLEAVRKDPRTGRAVLVAGLGVLLAAWMEDALTPRVLEGWLSLTSGR